MIKNRYFHDIVIALESILSNKLKSVLTGLGIIFGVAAVISMLAIGNGARQEILEQMKMVGVNNIVITPIVTPVGEESDEENGGGENKQKSKFSPGLSLADAEAIRQMRRTESHAFCSRHVPVAATPPDARKPPTSTAKSRRRTRSATSVVGSNSHAAGRARTLPVAPGCKPL